MDNIKHDSTEKVLADKEAQYIADWRRLVRNIDPALVFIRINATIIRIHR